MVTLNYLSSIIAALVLCVSSAALVAWHIRAWKQLQHAEIGPRQRDFRRRQYRRRMQTSALLGVLGVAILIGQLLMIWVTSRLFLAILTCPGSQPSYFLTNRQSCEGSPALSGFFSM